MTVSPAMDGGIENAALSGLTWIPREKLGPLQNATRKLRVVRVGLM